MNIAQTRREPDDWNRIRCVVFDAVETVIFAQPAVADVYATIGARHGSKRTQADISRQFRAVFPRLMAEHNTRGALPGQTSEEDESQFWRDVVTTMLDDVEQPHACFQELWEHFARPVAWRCFDDVGPTISALKGRGYKLVIASNFDNRLHRVCDGLPELRDVSCRVISSRVGFRKPSVRFFEATLENVGCRADEVLMVGDDFQNDIAAARMAGLKACWLRRNLSRIGFKTSTLARRASEEVEVTDDFDPSLARRASFETASLEIHPSADAITSLTELLELLP